MGIKVQIAFDDIEVTDTDNFGDTCIKKAKKATQEQLKIQDNLVFH